MHVLEGELMLTCGGSGYEPFTIPIEIGGVKSQLIIGPAGTGKSSLLGTMAANHLANGARIAWLDLDYSSFVLTHLLDGAYYELGAQDATPLCPLASLDQPGGVEWLDGWFERLFARWKYETSEREAELLHSLLDRCQNRGIRKLSDMVGQIAWETGRTRRILRHYTTYWKHIFDGEPREQGNQQLTVYELRGMMGMGKRAAAPATELILHEIISRLDGSPTWVFVDEFWQMLGDEVSAEWLFDSIRTLRKYNAGLVGASQSLLEIVNSPYRDLLLESCPGKLFLPNAEASHTYGREQYRKVGLNDHEISCIASAQPRRQFYFHSAIGSRLATLDLGPLATRICTSTGYNDVQRARAIISKYGRLPLSEWLAGLPVPSKTQATEGSRMAIECNQ